jgi:hypothetical protein
MDNAVIWVNYYWPSPAQSVLFRTTLEVLQLRTPDSLIYSAVG